MKKICLLLGIVLSLNFAASAQSSSSSCSAGEPVYVFTQNFGSITQSQLDAEEAGTGWFGGSNLPDHLYQWRRDFSDVGINATMPGYVYNPWPYKINDGNYALVADPYWCGCGSGGLYVDNCTPEPRTTAETEGTTNWYRGFFTDGTTKFRDHTSKVQADDADEYGLCLMINYKSGDVAVAYQHELTDAEKAELTPGATVMLEAYIASIAKEWSGTSVSMTLNLQFRDEGSTSEADWQTISTITETVDHADNWKRVATSEFPLGSSRGDYRLQVMSSGASGVGNDVLIDDITLQVCRPTIGIYFEETAGDRKMEETFESESDDFTIIVPSFNAETLGLTVGNPCVMLFAYNPSPAAGEKTYTYVGDFTEVAGSTPSGYSPDYTCSVNFDALSSACTLPATISFVAIAIPHYTMDYGASKQAVIDAVEANSIDFDDENNGSSVYRSDNFITMSASCTTEDPSLIIGTSGSVTEMEICNPVNADDYPVITLNFSHFADNVEATLYQGTSQLDVITLTAAELAAGSKTISLSAYANALNWAVGGSYTLSVNIAETLASCTSPACTSTSNDVTFTIAPVPSITQALPAEIAVCGDDDVQVEAVVENANVYDWMYSTDNGASWNPVGNPSNSATYVFPPEAQKGWQYKLVARYVTPSGDECGSDESTVIINVGGPVETPVMNNYNECPTTGTLSVADLMEPYSGSGKIVWMDASGNDLASAPTFDASVIGSTEYQVMVEEDVCKSDVVTFTVNVKDQAEAADLQGSGLEVCTGSEATLTASTSLQDNNMLFTWYTSQDLTTSLGTGDLSITGPAATTTYYVTVQGDNTCENLPGDAYELTVTAKSVVTAISLSPETETVKVGADVSKTLTVTPADAVYTAAWTANGAAVDPEGLVYTGRPFVDTEYVVVVRDECDNTLNASATAAVQWPTVFTPHTPDGFNDDFLGGMDDVKLEIFDRSGNKVFEGSGGWPQQNAATKMPDVYYYVATLPDGNVKKGTIEIYK